MPRTGGKEDNRCGLTMREAVANVLGVDLPFQDTDR